MDKKVTIAVMVTAIIFGALGFGGGVLTTRATGAAGAGRFTGQGIAGGATRDFVGPDGAAGRGQRMGGGGVAVGKITEKDDKSFTVKMPDGSSKVVYYSSTTTFDTVSEGSASDLSVDTTVTAMGTATDSGDITAQRVTIGGSGFGGMMRFGGPGGQGVPGGTAPAQ